ncbi:hypothetical protein BU24DRAFT_389776 [Aaosphaeria arxii CBS 175.79]|uniref:DUF4360 domain-containing protein n=1 Tax=Aaosphaeria arxii CBS 175.79 TaxID=1450172 RepID=A0A6A5XXN9_9PLEO|nr:uncharacterized protein BU24DRAFT_389776 [Aaosphaeria arxii CBS 175.79]KAF2018095.1 hypothetical protein BU24DRAFT_389776 [Aaosphaeria arxii CBS 175.79]
MRYAAAIISTLPLLSFSSPLPQGAPSGHEVEITGITYGGTGCPDKTVQGLLSDDRTTIALSFDAYTVQSGPSIPATERRKFCQLQLKIKKPSGFQYSIFGADYRGYASLEKGVTGTTQSTYYFSGEQNQTVIPTSFTGPMEGNYLKHDEIDAGSTVWSPCGEPGILNIKSEVRIVPMAATGLNLLTVDTVDAKFTQKYFVQWQKCDPKKGGNGGGGSGGLRPPTFDDGNLGREVDLSGRPIQN